MKNFKSIMTPRLKSAFIILILTAAGACSSTMNLPGSSIAAASQIYFIPLEKHPYMIYLSAQEPKEKSRSFSLADSVTATGTLLYPATIEKINNKAFNTYNKILGERLVFLPPELRKTKHSFLGTRKGYRFKRFKADFFIKLKFRDNKHRARAEYKIQGLGFLQEALPVYPEGPPLLLDIFMRDRDSGKFIKVYRKELFLFKKASEKESLESFNEPFIWHSAYASGEKQLRFDFQKHVTILRASVLERIYSFFLLCGDELNKAMHQKEQP